ncbi:MAG TPA: hypothetical protein VNO70_09410 [Blastocatellia bacterium]|nr:hypothetical protein [Blastocatellia bacterium]
MKITRILFLITLAVLTFAHRSDGQAARPVAEQLRLAGVMPRGALVYVQARDLGALMKMWLASPVRAQFYKSASFSEFSNSGIYLKFQERRKDFEKAIGFGLDESRLAEIAGGASAIAIYDIGKLEIAFVTEVPRERAIATALFKQAPQFQERSTDGGVYYVRDVTTDSGRLNQQFCFAYTGGKLLVTTTEGLMIRALGHAKSGGSDALLSDILALAQQADGFAAHEITMYLDQARLNKNRYFNNYWVHRNVAAFDNIESGLLDLRITPEGMNEQRWFTLSSNGEKNALTGEQAGALLRFAPADAQLIETRADVKGLGEAVSHALFGQLKEGVAAPENIPDHTSDNDGGRGGRTERYSRLDTRFDRDVDDEQAPGKKSQISNLKSQISDSKSQAHPPALTAAIAALPSVAYCEMARSKLDASRPFARFERAIIIEMREGAAPDRAGLERAISDEMRARFVIAGVDPGLTWQDDAGVRFVAQSLLEQGAAYTVSGKYLVLASSREFVRDILQAAASAARTPGVTGPVQYYAVVRVGQARPVFDKLMMKLDGKTEQAPNPDQEEGQEVKFFSDNLSSLIAASAVRELRVERETAGALMRERVVYSW